jgi:L-asparaginase
MTNDDTIQVLTTGGTIDKQYFDSLSEYQITDTIVTRLLEIARVTQPHRVEEMFRKDSNDISEEDRATLVARIRADEAKRFVITHGTDTMTVTAESLAGIPGKVIILVGAFTPARFAESDAVFNLGMAFAAAQTAAPGVYIAMNGTISNASEVVKDRAKGAFVRRDAQ